MERPWRMETMVLTELSQTVAYTLNSPTEVREKTTVSELSSCSAITTKKRTKSIHRARET